MSKRKNNGNGQAVDDELTRYIETGDIEETIVSRSSIDAVIRDPQLLSVADATDGEETSRRIELTDQRAIIGWLANRYPGVTGQQLVLALARDVSRADEVAAAARDFFAHRPEISPPMRFRHRAELAARLKWLLEI